jgi:hypothetical protein
MDLIFDDYFNGESNYCSHCFSNGSFNHPFYSLEDFSILVESQLKLKGFNDKQIQKRLKKLKKLNRWVKKFDWN